MFSQNSTPFALIEKDGIVTHYSGEIYKLDSLEELKRLSQSRVEEIIFMNPFRTIRERGYEAYGDEPILALVVSEKSSLQKEDMITLLADKKTPKLSDFSPSISDETYKIRVKEIQENEIAGGNICQMIFSRSLIAHLASDPLESALATYRNLLTQKGQYMTFLFSDGSENIFVSATPEEHLGIHDENVAMMPIAGTTRKGDIGDLKKRLENFLSNSKEINELAQVLDEELKMMERICDRGGKIEGPFLRQNGAVIHTEYRLMGKKKSGTHPIDLLRETLHAPTLTGGPIQSAVSRIAKYEGESRGYYGGEIGILQSDGDLDTAISIRMAHFLGKSVQVRSGAGIVRDSTPEGELAEIGIKAQGIISAIRGTITETPDVSHIIRDPEILELLANRNEHLSRFHFESQGAREPIRELIGKKAVIIDNEDNFSSTIARMMRVMGMEVEVILGKKSSQDIMETKDVGFDKEKCDLVVIGPGPGDINDLSMVHLQTLTIDLMMEKMPLLGICLGHQMIASLLGMSVTKQDISTQGNQQEELLFGKNEYLGFYNSFSPLQSPDFDGEIETNEEERVISFHKKNISGFQFHPESVMTQNGFEILKNEILRLIG